MLFKTIAKEVQIIVAMRRKIEFNSAGTKGRRVCISQGNLLLDVRRVVGQGDQDRCVF